MKAGRGISFKSSKEAISYTDVLIENDRQLTKNRLRVLSIGLTHDYIWS